MKVPKFVKDLFIGGIVGIVITVVTKYLNSAKVRKNCGDFIEKYGRVVTNLGRAWLGDKWNPLEDTVQSFARELTQRFTKGVDYDDDGNGPPETDSPPTLEEMERDRTGVYSGT